MLRLQTLAVLVVLASASLLIGPGTCFAQREDPIEAARLKGLDFLKEQQLADGSWFYEGHSIGITALCGLALIENGVPVSDKAVEKAQGYVKQHLSDLKNTYDIALAILFLSRVGDRDNRAPIRDLAARLVAGQNVEGGWSYSNPLVSASILTSTAERPAPPDGPGDNSCTQFAVLGLWVASRWGVNVDETMERVGARFLDTQMEDGGWAYNHAAETAASGNSMTFAGLFCLAVARATEIRKHQEELRKNPERIRDPKVAASETLLDDETVSKGLVKAGQFATGVGPGAARYFLWSVERLGVLLGLEQFGNTDWFAKGADALIKTQAENGSWEHPTWGNLADTSFAVLFLRKANLGSDISQLLEGEPEKKFLISNRADKPRFLRLTDALKEAKPGDVIRVDGNGPFDMPHLEFNQDLTIEAGPGYTPVFRYDLGYDETGRRSRPENDPNARHMLRVNEGTLVLEGLELRMDPPELRGGVTWAAIVLNGGTLRLLNCSVSESNKQGTAGIYVTKPCHLLARNCLFVGGRAGLEILTGGEQNVRLENTVIFSKNAFNVFNGPEGESPQLALHLERCAVQARDVFYFPKLTNPVNITSLGCAYKADWMGSTMAATPARPKHITWTGQDNLYEVQRWIGAVGTPIATLKDEKTWNTFWGGTDANGSKKQIPFVGKRQHDAYNHTVSGEDFEFSPGSSIYVYRRKTGIDPLTVGPGRGFSRYRESFDYRNGERGMTGAVAAN